jgi:hypothetical protein
LLCHTLSSPWSITVTTTSLAGIKPRSHRLSLTYDWNWCVTSCPVLCISWWFSYGIGDRPLWITKLLFKFRQLKILSAPLRQTICARNQM